MSSSQMLEKIRTLIINSVQLFVLLVVLVGVSQVVLTGCFYMNFEAIFWNYVALVVLIILKNMIWLLARYTTNLGVSIHLFAFTFLFSFLLIMTFSALSSAVSDDSMDGVFGEVLVGVLIGLFIGAYTHYKLGDTSIMDS